MFKNTAMQAVVTAARDLRKAQQAYETENGNYDLRHAVNQKSELLDGALMSLDGMRPLLPGETVLNFSEGKIQIESASNSLQAMMGILQQVTGEIEKRCRELAKDPLLSEDDRIAAEEIAEEFAGATDEFSDLENNIENLPSTTEVSWYYKSFP